MLDINWKPSLCISTFTTVETEYTTFYKLYTREIFKIYFRNTKTISFWIPHTTQTDRQAEYLLLTQDDVSVPLHCLQQHFDLSEGEPWLGFQPCSYSSDFKLLIFIAPRGWHCWPLSRPSPPPPLMASNNSAWNPISPPSGTVSSRSTCQPGLKTPGWLLNGLERSESNTER